ncbi:TdeIII family type II restriction endonuclease, partial [Leptospira levettii]|uniref:TdeIII family type II restriction endonuclease n=1 Tax=Leptospira levettii TaxID=2023178 RepID=UPI0010835C21
YAYYYSKYPNGEAYSRIVFPYNPYGINFWEKAKGKGKPLEKDSEAWVGDQFWSFCTGSPNTYELILDSFSQIREERTLEIHFKGTSNLYHLVIYLIEFQ